jgi:hypothetical protein
VQSWKNLLRARGGIDDFCCAAQARDGAATPYINDPRITGAQFRVKF